jgi:two-component system LytT family response regulator
MYKAIIIDDEEMARTLLEGMIKEYCHNVNVVDLCQDLPSGIKSIRRHKPDLIFLDIEMPGHSGLELLDFFDESDIDFSIIFVTAYDQYAIQAFKLSTVDYLLKPIESDDLINSILLFEKQKNNRNYQVLKENFSAAPKKIGINTANTIQFISLDDILFFKADGAYTHLYLNDGKTILASKNLKHFENATEEIPNFLRCHKSFLININYVSEYVKSDGGYLKTGQHNISVSPDKLQILLSKLGMNN